MEKKVSYFKSFVSQPEEVDLNFMLGAIKEGAYQEQIQALRKMDEKEYGEAKQRLPHFTPSGKFKEKRRSENLSEYSQVMVLDIDDIGEDALKIKNKSAEIEYTLAAFLSPSGKGVKILVSTDSTREKHEAAFNQIVDYYEKRLKTKIDVSGKDISRACFVSWDPEMFINEDAKTFEVNITLNFNYIEPDFKKAVDFTQNQQEYFEGNRNNFIYQLACNCNRYGLGIQKVIEQVSLTYDLEQNEVVSTITSAYKNVKDHGIYKYVISKTNDSYRCEEPSATGVWNIFDLIKRNNEEPKYNFLWNGIKESSFGYIFGPPKVGKTIFCENLGMSIAAGLNSFLGFPIIQSGKRKVLFIGMEEFWRNRTERNEKQLMQLSDIDKNNFPYYTVDEKFPSRFKTQKEWDQLEYIITQYEPNVVFIDSMTRTIEGEIEDSSHSRDASIKLRELVKKYEITLIMIHHTTKLNGEQVNIDKMAGSRVIAQEADFMYAIVRDEFNKHFLKEVATRYKAESEEQIFFNINENLWLERGMIVQSHWNTKKDLRTNPENEEFIFNLITDNTTVENPMVETKEIVEKAKDTITVSEIYRYMANLDKKGKITRGHGFVGRP